MYLLPITRSKLRFVQKLDDKVVANWKATPGTLLDKLWQVLGVLHAGIFNRYLFFSWFCWLCLRSLLSLSGPSANRFQNVENLHTKKKSIVTARTHTLSVNLLHFKNIYFQCCCRCDLSFQSTRILYDSKNIFKKKKILPKICIAVFAVSLCDSPKEISMCACLLSINMTKNL